MNDIRTIAIGSDHAGYEQKAEIVAYLAEKGFELKDVGTFSAASVDYPDYAHQVATAVENGDADCGILLCGSANGVAITANKHQGIRCALAWSPEIAALARQHNDANVVAIPARFVSASTAFEICDTFLREQFEGGRHLNRVQKIACV